LFVLDSNHLSILQQQSGPEFNILQSNLSPQRPENIATTIIAFQEQIEGWFTYLKKARDAPWHLEGVSSNDARSRIFL